MRVILKVEIVEAEEQRVKPTRLIGYILRAIAGVVANNGGVVANLTTEVIKEKE